MEKNKTTQLLMLVIILMVIGIGFAVFKLITVNRDYEALSVEMGETITAKDLLEDDLKVLYSEYDSVQTENTVINEKLKEEQQKISDMITQMKRERTYSANEIKKLRAEIDTKTRILKSYVAQIDSLDRLNHQLIAENNEVRKNNKRLQYEMETVVEHNDQLELTVEMASVVKASNFKSLCYKRKGKTTHRASKVRQIQNVFTLVENNIAEKGERTIYVRIVRPDGHVMSKDINNIFEFKGGSLAFSEKRNVKYDGAFLDVIIYYDVTEDLLPGDYTVELYMDDNIIGKTGFTLD